MWFPLITLLSGPAWTKAQSNLEKGKQIQITHIPNWFKDQTLFSAEGYAVETHILF